MLCAQLSHKVVQGQTLLCIITPFERLALISGYQSVSHVCRGDDVVVLVVADDRGDGGDSGEGFGQQARA